VGELVRMEKNLAGGMKRGRKGGRKEGREEGGKEGRFWGCVAFLTLCDSAGILL